VAVEVHGRARGSSALMTTSITFEPGRDYWIHGATLATVARLAAEGKGIQPGLHFLADAFDPVALAGALREAGIVIDERAELPADAIGAH